MGKGRLKSSAGSICKATALVRESTTYGLRGSTGLLSHPNIYLSPAPSLSICYLHAFGLLWSKRKLRYINLIFIAINQLPSIIQQYCNPPKRLCPIHQDFYFTLNSLSSNLV